MSKGIYDDDRTHDDIVNKTYPILIGGRDRVLSGWGLAPKKSYAYWACRPEHEELVYNWVCGRGDIVNVDAYCGFPPKRREGNHTHVYVVKDSHPAIRRAVEAVAAQRRAGE